jgi:hypothetical protein
MRPGMNLNAATAGEPNASIELECVVNCDDLLNHNEVLSSLGYEISDKCRLVGKPKERR